MKASTVLAKLYICGHENLLLYRQLVTLKDDLEISEILHYSDSVTMTTSPRDSGYFSGSISGGGSSDKGNEDAEIVSQEHREDIETQLHSNYFRYVGEAAHAAEYLKSIHPSLLRPLQLLREQYHTLERRI